MATVGRKQLTYSQRQKLFRKTPRDSRINANSITENYQGLIKSFTVDDYQLYEKLMHMYKRTDAMMTHCHNQHVQGPVLELATIRSIDLKVHQKLLQILRYTWTDLQEQKTNAVNQDPNKYWYLMSGQIQRRCKNENIELYPEWQGQEGREKLIEFLKERFQKQNGICAVSNEPITLTIGAKSKNANKCSPDRKNSNKGYTPDNIWFVTWWVNAMKMDMPMITFYKRIKILYEVRNQQYK
jgi:hypothetical protein